MSIYTETQAIADSGLRVLVMLSRGRDSLCMAKVLKDFVHPDKLVFLHLQTYRGLSYQEAHLRKIERAFGIALEVQDSREGCKMRGEKGFKDYSTERNHWRQHYNCDTVAFGFRSDESVSRSVIMRQWQDGINHKSQECYPLKRWNRSIVAKYAKRHKLPMAEEYEYDLRDISGQFVKHQALWLHDTHPNDFLEACKQDKALAAEYVRHTGNQL